MLEIRNLSVRYSELTVVRHVSIAVGPSEIITLLGSNAAGKSTIIRAISGLIQDTEGEIFFDDKKISSLSTKDRVECGIIQVPEGRRLFANMTVEENLIMGSFCKRAKPKRKSNLEKVYSLFPRIKERKWQQAGSLSGGEQQMCALGRALMAEPRLLMLDEPSLGLAPIIVSDIFKKIEQLHEEDVAILLVEQNVKKSLEIADRGYVLKNGEIVIQGSNNELLQNSELQKAYLGI